MNAGTDTGKRRRWVIRALIVVLGLGAWFWTQSLIGNRERSSGSIHDGVHMLTALLHQYFLNHPTAADGLLIVSSAFIDLFGIFLLGRFIFGSSIRPFLGLLILFVLRQLCQALCALPLPEGMIWRYPGFPSLLVTYGVSNDLFFSGHTAIAVFGATELWRLDRPGLKILGVAIAVFEALTVLVLRAHYTMDVFAAIVAALLVANLVGHLAPRCDNAIARI